MDPDAAVSAQTVVNEWPESRIAEILRNYADERHARSIARRIVERRRSTRPPSWSRRSAPACPRQRGSAAETPPSARPGDPDRRQRRARRDRRGASRGLGDARSRRPARGDLVPLVEDRRVKRFLADRARGCVCPPEFPVCRCGSTRGEAGHPGRNRPERRRDRRQPALGLGPPPVAVKLDRGEDG